MTVHGIKRRTSLFNTDRIDHLYQDPHEKDLRLHPASRRPDGFVQPGPHRRSRCSPTRSTTSPRRAMSRCRSKSPNTPPTPTRSARCAARGDPHPRAREEDALLPGLDLRAVRPGAGDAADGDDAVLSALALRASPSSTPTGSRSTIARPTACTPATASCSTTSRRCAARPSSRARSRARWRASSSGFRTASISATSTPSATGAMPATMSRCSG